MPTPRPTLAAPPVGALLRHWRALRGKSQLRLSADSGITQKHISFVESGRSQPSRGLLLGLAEALEMPLRERNDLLAAAGFAPVYPAAPLDAAARAGLQAALQRMLRQHEPFPALVLDRHWNVLSANDAAPRFFGCFADLRAWPAPRNLLRLMLDPAGVRPHVADWDETARGLIARVRREAPGHAPDAATQALLDTLGRHPGVDPRARVPSPADESPVIPLRFSKGGETLSYFSLVTTVGTPRSVAAEELRLECMFPADEHTERAHERFVAANAWAPG